MDFLRKTSVLLVSCFLLGAILPVAVQGESCFTKFKNAADAVSIMKKCHTQVGIDDKEITPDALEKSGYEDKCFYNCVLTEMKMVQADGKLDMSKIEEDFKVNAPADRHDALMAIVKSCSEAASKNPLSKDPCKTSAIAKACYLKQEATVC